MDDSALAIFTGVNWVIGLGIAVLIGFLIGKDAESRGMNGIGWGVFTFLACIIAVPIYLIVRKPRLDERR